MLFSSVSLKPHLVEETLHLIHRPIRETAQQETS